MQFLSALALAATAGAAVVNEPRQAGAVFVDNYNDKPTGRPVGLYHGLNYGGAVVAEHRFPNGTQSIVPHTQPKFAYSSTEIDFFQLGAMSFESFIQLQRGPGVSSFDFNSFYLACAVDDGSTYGVAQGCTVAVVGYKADTGRELSVVTYSYAPESFNEAPFIYAQLPEEYNRLQNVSIGIATGSTLAERTALAVDDLSHTNRA